MVKDYKYVYDVLTAVKIQIEVFCVMTPCSAVVFTLKIDLRNFGNLPQHYTASQPRRT
jgi:hypothetical protein